MTITLLRTPRGRAVRAGNYIPNPRLDANASGWLSLNGGGQVTESRTSSTLPSVAWAWTVTWTQGTNGPQGGFSTPAANVAPGYYVYSVWVISQKAQRVRLAVQFSNGDVVNATDALLQQGVWTRLFSPAVPTPAGATTARITVGATPGAGASNWVAGDAIAGTAAAVTNGRTLWEFFDGNTGTNGDVTYSWTGAQGLSTSLSTWSDPATLIQPEQLADGYSYSVLSNNTVHQLLSGQVAATLMQGGLRSGVLKLLFLDRLSAKSCAAMHAGIGTWAYEDTENSEMGMYYVVTPGPIPVYQTDTRKTWVCEIPFSEIST